MLGLTYPQAQLRQMVPKVKVWEAHLLTLNTVLRGRHRIAYPISAGTLSKKNMYGILVGTILGPSQCHVPEHQYFWEGSFHTQPVPRSLWLPPRGQLLTAWL